MAISETNICNMALMKVGAKPLIASLVENSDNARLCNTFYAPVRDAVLRGHPWNCALHRSSITPESTTPTSDWDYQYQLPANPYCLRVMQIGLALDQPIRWTVEGRKLLSDEGSTHIVYIKRITDTNEFDPLLVDALTLALAIKIAMPLAKDAKMVDSLIKELELVTLPLARTIDGQETSGQAIIADEWERSRY